MAYIIKRCDDHGMELRYTIESPSCKPVKSKDSTAFKKSLESTKPRGTSDMKITLDSILAAYSSQLHATLGAGVKVTARSQKGVQPSLMEIGILVATSKHQSRVWSRCC